MARAPRAGDRVGAEAATTEGIDTNLVQSAPVRLTENVTPALGLINGATARLEQTAHNGGGGGRMRARGAGARGSIFTSASLRFAAATPTVLPARPPDGHGALPSLRPCALTVNGMRASAPAHVLRADARA